MQNAINGPDAGLFQQDPSFYSGPAAARRGGRPNQNFIPGVDDAGSGAETQEFRPSRGDANLTPGYLSEGGGGAISPLGPRVRNATIGYGAAPVTAATAGAVGPVPLSPYPNTQRLLGANDAQTESDYAARGGNVGKVVQNGTTIAQIGGETRELPRYEEAPGVTQMRQQVHADSMSRKADILGGNYFTNRTNTVDANSRLNDQTGANVNFTNSGAHLRDADAAATTTLTPLYGQKLQAQTNNLNADTAETAPNAAAQRGKTQADADATRQGGAVNEQRYRDMEKQHGEAVRQNQEYQREIDRLNRVINSKGFRGGGVIDDGSGGGGSLSPMAQGGDSLKQESDRYNFVRQQQKDWDDQYAPNAVQKMFPFTTSLFHLEPPKPPGPRPAYSPAGTQAAPQTYAVGQTITNKQTGKSMRWDGQQFVAVN